MRTYPLLRDPISGTAALAILARAGLTPPVAVLAVRETGRGTYPRDTLHLDPSCPRDPDSLTICVIDTDDLAGLDEDHRTSVCDCLSPGPLADWITARLTLTNALWALGQVDEELPLDVDAATLTGIEQVQAEVSLWGPRARQHLGALRAVHYGLSHPTGEPEDVEDLEVALATAEALAALGDALETRAALLDRVSPNTEPLHRWVVSFAPLYLGGSIVHLTPKEVLEAIGGHGILGSRLAGAPAIAALLAPVSVLGSHDGAINLGPARDHDTAAEVFATYDLYQQVRDKLRGDGYGYDEAETAALTSVTTTHP